MQNLGKARVVLNSLTIELRSAKNKSYLSCLLALKKAEAEFTGNR